MSIYTRLRRRATKRTLYQPVSHPGSNIRSINKPQRNNPPKIHDFTAREEFKPTPEIMKWLKENSTPVLPKNKKVPGRMKNGILLDFSKCPTLLNEILERFIEVYPHAASWQLKEEQGFIEVGFSTSEDADDALDKPFMIEDFTLPCYRTRAFNDTSISLQFDNLPTTLNSQLLYKELFEGLAHYGQVVNLDIETDSRVPHLSGSRAIANIVPNAIAGTKGESIPKIAYLHSAIDEPFLVAPDDTQLVCGVCFKQGHFSLNCTPSATQIPPRKKGSLWGGAVVSESEMILNRITLSSLPQVTFPETLAGSDIDSLKLNREEIQKKLNVMKSYFIEALDKTEITHRVESKVIRLRIETEFAILRYVKKVKDLGLLVSEIDPTFSCETQMDEQRNNYLKFLEESSHLPLYGIPGIASLEHLFS